MRIRPAKEADGDGTMISMGGRAPRGHLGRDLAGRNGQPLKQVSGRYVCWKTGGSADQAAG